MPFFSTQPSSSLTSALRSAVGSLGGPDPLKLLQAQHLMAQNENAASQTQYHSAMAQKALAEVNAARQAETLRADPAAQAQVAGDVAGMNTPDASRLMNHLRGVMEQPSAMDDEDASLVGATAKPFVTSEPVMQPGQRTRFQEALAGLGFNRMATGKTNAAELGKAVGEVQGQGITQAVQNALARGDAQGASGMNQGGKLGNDIKLFDNVGSTGATFAPATGAVQADPAAQPDNKLLGGTLAEIAAKAVRERAQAEQARAAAGAHSASAARTRDLMTREQKGTYDSARGILVDPVRGTSRAVTDDAGAPIGSKEVPAKALPASAAKGLLENQQSLRRAEQALALISGEEVPGPDGAKVKGDPNATGWKGYLPDALLQRKDAGGVPTRAAIGDLGSLIIHDRSGAAVSVSEFPRLRPFIPQVTDDPATVKAKLGRFVQEYRNIAAETADFYTESGYKVPTETLRGSGASGSTDGADRRAAPRAPAKRVVVDF